MDNKLAILILAAGSSSRLGKAKQLLRYKGRTLLQYQIDIAERTDIPVYINVGCQAPLMLQTIQTKETTAVLCNHTWEQGMGNSICNGVKAIQADGYSGVIISVCDQPFLTQDIWGLLMRKISQQPDRIIISQYENGMGPPSYFPAKYFEELIALQGEEGAKKIVHKHQKNSVFISFPKGNIDIDTEQDLKYLDSSESM